MFKIAMWLDAVYVNTLHTVFTMTCALVYSRIELYF